MKLSHKLTKSLIIIFFTLPLYITGCSSEDTDKVTSITTTDTDGATTVDEAVLTDILDGLPLDELSTVETNGLIFMREEEKLARDVYTYLFTRWNVAVFDNISNSEQTHTDAILTLLDRYNVTDPVGNNAESVFVDSTLQNLYDTLVAQGSASLIDALIVGAAIEEIDLIDIQNLVDLLEGNADIALVYENLMKGSRNHLRAFVGNLEANGVIYQPRYLSQDEYDAIINADLEAG